MCRVERSDGVARMSNVANSKEKRQQCWDARDRFFACAEEGGACDEQRTAYEAACPPSWVKHFGQARRYEREKARRIAAIEKVEEQYK